MKRAIIAILLIFLSFLIKAQNSVGIGVANSNNNAVLELVSPNNNQGFLTPRLSTTQKNAMSGSLTNSENGLLIFDNETNLFSYWNSGQWSDMNFVPPGDGSVFGSGAVNQLAFWSSDNNLSTDSNLFWDSSNSYLGVGTSTPFSHLHIVGTVDDATGNNGVFMSIDNNNVTPGALSGIRFKSNDTGTTNDAYKAAILFQRGGNDGNPFGTGSFIFALSNEGDDNSNFAVSDAVFTINNFQAALYQTGATNKQFRVNANTTFTGTISPFGPISLNFSHGNDGALLMSTGTGTAPEWTTTSTIQVDRTHNRVGIGSTWPQHKLVVDDNASDFVAEFRNTNTAIGAGAIKASLGPAAPSIGTLYIGFYSSNGSQYQGGIEGTGAGGVNLLTTSDRRLKENIIDAPINATDILKNTRIRQFNYIGSSKAKIGFIAQELMETYPSAVTGDENGDPLTDPMTVAYSELIPVLIKGFQELKAEVESLKAQNRSLQHKIDRNTASIGPDQ